MVYFIYLQDISRHITCKSQEYSRLIRGIYQVQFGYSSGISYVYIRYISGISQLYLRCISDISQVYICLISGIYRVYLRHISSAISQEYLRHISGIYRPYFISCISKTYSGIPQIDYRHNKGGFPANLTHFQAYPSMFLFLTRTSKFIFD